MMMMSSIFVFGVCCVRCYCVRGLFTLAAAGEVAGGHEPKHFCLLLLLLLQIVIRGLNGQGCVKWSGAIELNF